MKIVVIGKEGKLGSKLISYLSITHEVYGLNKSELDLVEIDKLEEKLNIYSPEIIINAAAYTDVDNAEHNRQYVLKVNSNSLKFISKVAKGLGTLLIHFSTDYVFDGTKKEPYIESDQVNPINFYGLSKKISEDMIIKSGCKYLIFRISTLLGGYEENIVYKILDKSCSGKSIEMVEDQLFTPSTTDFIVKHIDILLSDEFNRKFSFDSIYHLTPKGKISPYDLTKKIFKLFNSILNKSYLNTSIITPVSMVDYKTKAKRPKNCLLDSSKFFNEINLEYPSWESQFEDFAYEVISKYIDENKNIYKKI